MESYLSGKTHTQLIPNYNNNQIKKPLPEIWNCWEGIAVREAMWWVRVRGVRVGEDSVWVRVEDALFLGERLLSLENNELRRWELPDIISWFRLIESRVFETRDLIKQISSLKDSRSAWHILPSQQFTTTSKRVFKTRFLTWISSF